MLSRYYLKVTWNFITVYTLQCSSDTILQKLRFQSVQTSMFTKPWRELSKWRCITEMDDSLTCFAFQSLCNEPLYFLKCGSVKNQTIFRVWSMYFVHHAPVGTLIFHQRGKKYDLLTTMKCLSRCNICSVWRVLLLFKTEKGLRMLDVGLFRITSNAILRGKTCTFYVESRNNAVMVWCANWDSSQSWL